METLTELGLDHLSPTARLNLLEVLWDSLADYTAHLPPTSAQLAELRRRIEESNAHPEAVTPWEQIRDRALARGQR
jgi:putative addiction module component (TIGR02574 family)